VLVIVALVPVSNVFVLVYESRLCTSEPRLINIHLLHSNCNNLQSLLCPKLIQHLVCKEPTLPNDAVFVPSEFILVYEARLCTSESLYKQGPNVFVLVYEVRLCTSEPRLININLYRSNCNNLQSLLCKDKMYLFLCTKRDFVLQILG
jgi:hypothetical protein